MRLLKGQSLLEFAVLLAIIVSALMIMQVYIKRAYQGGIKAQADQVGPQYSPSHTTGVTVTNTTVETESYTGGDIVRGGQTYTVPDGVMVTLTNTTTDFEKKEVVDSFKRESFQ